MLVCPKCGEPLPDEFLAAASQLVSEVDRVVVAILKEETVQGWHELLRANTELKKIIERLK